MFNWILVDTQTGLIKNAVSSPSEGVVPKIEDPETEALLAVSEEDFIQVFSKIKKYYNLETRLLEPENIYKFSLTGSPVIPIGTTVLSFQQQDLEEAPVVSPAGVEITIRDTVKSVLVEDGVLEIEVTCPEATVFPIKITASRHDDLELEVAVNA